MAEASARFFHQPKAVWATAFACVVGFMSIGLVDPILTSIAAGLNATPSQVSLLFTSYFFVTSVMMLGTGFVSSRIGGRNTLLLGAGLIVLFAALAGTSDSVAELVSFRAGWGLGNAFFVVTALSVIVACSRGGTMAAILMYEAAMGLGLSAGPLLGAALGEHSWRYPFFGTATLMAIGFLAIYFWLPEQPKPAQKTSLTAPLKALAHGGLLTTSASAFFYYLSFFVILAFTPFVLQMTAHAVGMIFFGWGLMLAVFSVFVSPRLAARFSQVQILSGCMFVFAVLMALMMSGDKNLIAACIVISGAVSGIANTLYTGIALEVSDSPRPVASAGYNFVRWFAGVIAPFAAPEIARLSNAETTFAVAAGCAVIAALILLVRRQSLQQPQDDSAYPAAGERSVMVALSGAASDRLLLQRAANLARLQQRPVELLHARTWETAADDAVDLENRQQAQQVLCSAQQWLATRNVLANATLLEIPASQLAHAVQQKIHELNPLTVVLGRSAEHKLAHIQHDHLAELLQKDKELCSELLIVPA